MLFNHLKHNNLVYIGTRVSIFLMVVSDVSPGIQEGLLGRFLRHKISRELKLKSGYGTLIQGNANAGGSAICIHKDLLSDNAIFESPGSSGNLTWANFGKQNWR